MSEQIREQVSAFLDGELPNSETELLLKRLTRDGELRESFGRYALIGEAVRGNSRGLMIGNFTGRVNLAIDGGPAAPSTQVRESPAPRWWRPFAGAAVEKEKKEVMKSEKIRIRLKNENKLKISKIVVVVFRG
jgi:negative regulator of sigma E activity